MQNKVYIGRTLFSLLLVALLIFTVAKFDLISYGWMQGKGQMKVLLNTRPVSEVLADPAFPDSLKIRLRIIQQAKEFAGTVGLESNDNYSTYYDQKGKTILWNLSACEPFSFTPYTWTFPFTGKVSYKGFFDLEKAKKERDKLKKMGYDTRIRPVSAWSTLGWFNDPILSNLLHEEIGDMVETVFHELTHQTVFFKDSIEFNENLASFIGKEAARKFLIEKYGDQSDPLKTYLTDEADSKMYREHIMKGKQCLHELYESFEPDLEENFKKVKKDSLIRRIFTSLDTVEFNSDKYAGFSKLENLPNNAYFMSFSRYHGQSGILDSLYATQNSDLQKFVGYCKKRSN